MRRWASAMRRQAADPTYRYVQPLPERAAPAAAQAIPA